MEEQGGGQEFLGQVEWGEIARIFGRKGKCQVGSFCLFFISVLVLDKESCSKVLVAINV